MREPQKIDALKVGDWVVWHDPKSETTEMINGVPGPYQVSKIRKVTGGFIEFQLQGDYDFWWFACDNQIGIVAAPVAE